MSRVKESLKLIGPGALAFVAPNLTEASECLDSGGNVTPGDMGEAFLWDLIENFDPGVTDIWEITTGDDLGWK